MTQTRGEETGCWLPKLWRGVRGGSNLVSSTGAILLLCAAIATVVQVVLRTVFGSAILGLEELLSLIVGVGVAACIPAGFSGGQQLRVDGLVKLLPAWCQKPLFALGDVLLLSFLFVLAIMVLTTAQTYIGRGQTTGVMGVPVGPFFLGMAGGFLLAVPVKIARLLLVNDDTVVELLRFTLTLLGAVILYFLATAFGLVDWLRSGSGTDMAIRVFVGMWLLMFLGVPIAATMGLSGLVGLTLMLSWSPAATVVGSEAATFLSSQALAVLPLFLLMGALATLAGLSSDIYRFAHAALSPLRAGLCHATIVACAGFGALTGSSLATAATFGRIALPEMKERGYDSGLAAGSVAAGGTLGSLVPPSLSMILYALLSEQSIGRLFVAAILPALLAIVLYVLTIAIISKLRPVDSPEGFPIDWNELRDSAKGCFGAVLLFSVVIGGIYSGVFTDTEAASVGAIGAFLFALFRGRLGRDVIIKTLVETTTTISIIYMLIFGALTFSFFLAFSGMPSSFASMVQGWGLAPFSVILMLVACYLVLGAVMDSYAMMVITIPVFVPLVLSLGYDPIWWGVVTVICVELGMITPPFGLNLFIIKSVAPSLSLPKLWVGVIPFVLSDLVKLAIILAVPGFLIIG